MIRLYVDEQVRISVINALRNRGIDCLWAVDDGYDSTDDELILQRATSLDRVVYTYDNDFHQIAHRWLRQGRDFSGVIHAKWRQMSEGQEIREVELVANILEPVEVQNTVTHLPLH